MANDIKIKGSKPISEHFSTITVGDQRTCLEISGEDTGHNFLGARITGDLIVSGDITGNIKDIELDLTTINSTNLTIDDSGDITLDAAGGDVNILQADLTIPVNKKVIFGNTGEYITGDNTNLDIVSSADVNINAAVDIALNVGENDDIFFQTEGDTFARIYADESYSYLRLYETPGGTDQFTIATTTDGDTVLLTTDADGNEADMWIEADGYMVLRSYGYGASNAESVSQSITLKAGTKVLIDKDLSETTASTVTGLEIDLDKTGASTTNNTIYALNIDCDNTTAENGTNTMYGIHCTPTLTHAADAGTSTVIGAYIKATGASNGTSESMGLVIDQAAAGTADKNFGMQIRSAANTSDYFSIQTTTEGLTTISTVDADTAVAHLVFDIDGNIKFTEDGSVSKYIQFDTEEGQIDIHSAIMDYFRINVDESAATTLTTEDWSGDSGNLTLNIDGDITLNSVTGNFISENNGTEFSAANSAYAGMILGYTEIFDHALGLGEDVFQSTTTSFVNLSLTQGGGEKYLKVAFVVPPSNKVKITVHLPYCSFIDGILWLGLAIDDSAHTLHEDYNRTVWDVDESDSVSIMYHWTIEGGDVSWSAGDSITLYCMVKEDTAGGRLYCGDGVAINGGGWTMEAIALPATIGDGT